MKGVQATFLMTAYNSAAYIKEAIRSVLLQSYSDFELLIIDDASEDKTVDIIRFFKDERIKLVINKQNSGTAEAANRGLSLIHTPYLLRIDSDDICMPGRLKTQLEFMESHPEIGVCGSYIEYVGNRSGTWKMPLHDEEIRARMIYDNMMANSSVIIRTELLKSHQLLYRDDGRKPPLEDYRLWLELLPFTRFANLPLTLVKKREHLQSHTSLQAVNNNAAHSNLFHWFFEKEGLQTTEEEVILHTTVSRSPLKLNYVTLQAFHKWQAKLSGHFSQKHYMQPDAIAKATERKWLSLAGKIKLTTVLGYISMSKHKLAALKRVVGF